MAIQQWSTKLKLQDGDTKALGASRIQPSTVTCDDPALVEGHDFEIDYQAGTVRRLLDLGPAYERQLIGFSFSYDEGADPMADLRIERNRLLAGCDFTQLVDAPAWVNKADWATYRQQLRDLPANTVDPANPVWPAAPQAMPA